MRDGFKVVLKTRIPFRWLWKVAGGSAVVVGALASTSCSMPNEVDPASGRSPNFVIVPASGLLGDWKLNESSGTTAVDAENGYDATVNGSAAFTTGILGNALDLNNGQAGTGGKYAELPNNAALDNVQEGNYTISAWFYPYSVPADTSPTSNDRNWAIVLKYGQHTGLVYDKDQHFVMRHYLTGNVLETATGTTTHGVNNWYHVVGVVDKDAGTVKIYVNGTLEATQSFTAGTAAREYGTAHWRIGKALSTWAADGRVDQVRIYGRALTGAEITDLYDETAMVGDWRLDESSGTVAHDVQNSYDATVAGGAAFVTGAFGNALDLNNGQAGTGGKYAELPNNTVLDNVQEGDYTLSAWFYPYSVPADTSPTSNDRNWAIVLKYGQHTGLVYDKNQHFVMRHYLTGNVLEAATGTTAHGVNNWYHVAGVVDTGAGTIKIYVNGTLEATETFTPGTAAREYGTAHWRIGKALSTWAADGRVDQVRIYSRALTGTEITELYDEQTSTTGIPFGLFGINPDTLSSGTIWTGGVIYNKNLSGIVTQLGNAQSMSPHLGMWFGITGGDEQVYANGDGSFNLQRWEDTLDRVASPINGDGTSSFYDDFLPYIQDGTLQGILMLDDLGNFTSITAAQIDSMAAHLKLRFPTMVAAVRYPATDLQTKSGGAPYSSLDVAWGQFKSGLGAAATYRDNQIAAAKSLGLGLVLGINITNGGPPAGSNVPVDSLLAWGSEFLKPGASDYVCGFLMWNNTYGSLTHANMTTLAGMAASHVAAPCKRHP